MARETGIEWADATWNPVTGCTQIGPGCDHCYALEHAERFRGSKAFPVGFDLMARPRALRLPLQWRDPKFIFVNSMSDLFHERLVKPDPGGPVPEAWLKPKPPVGGPVPDGWLDRIFDVMEEADWHAYLVLTKRSTLMVRYLAERYAGHEVPPQIWLGVTVEKRRMEGRLNHLRKIPCRRRFVSFEPLLESVADVSLDGIDWAIVGGESGRRPRPFKGDWARQIRENCARSGTAFFFKQWGGRNKKAAGRELDGREWMDTPAPVQSPDCLPLWRGG